MSWSGRGGYLEEDGFEVRWRVSESKERGARPERDLQYCSLRYAKSSNIRLPRSRGSEPSRHPVPSHKAADDDIRLRATPPETKRGAGARLAVRAADNTCMRRFMLGGRVVDSGGVRGAVEKDAGVKDPEKEVRWCGGECRPSCGRPGVCGSCSSGSGDDITAGCALARAWKYGSRVARRPGGSAGSAETPPF